MLRIACCYVGLVAGALLAQCVWFVNLPSSSYSSSSPSTSFFSPEFPVNPRMQGDFRPEESFTLPPLTKTIDYRTLRIMSKYIMSVALNCNFLRTRHLLSSCSSFTPSLPRHPIKGRYIQNSSTQASLLIKTICGLEDRVHNYMVKHTRDQYNIHKRVMMLVAEPYH